MEKVLTPQEIIEINLKFKSYFDPEELVSKRVYDSFKNKDEIYDKFNIKLKAVVVYLREECFKVPFYCNNWKEGGQFQYKGYREPEYLLGAKKSQHREWNALDLDIKGFTAEQARVIVLRFMKNLPFPIRLERGVNWFHIDTANTTPHKIHMFSV